MEISIEDFYKNHTIASDFDENFYQKKYPETIDFYQPYCRENNIDDRHRLFFHYFIYNNQSKSYFHTKEKYHLICKILHIFPFEVSSSADVNSRQNFAIESYLQNKTEQTSIICFGEKDPNIDGIEFIKIKSSIKSQNREYYLLNELINCVLELTQDNDYIVYTNSDCYIQEGFYDFFRKNTYNYIEFFRQEIFENQVVGLNKDGIDGFAGSVSSIKIILNKLNDNNLVIGSPYWDAVVSNIAKEHIKNIHQDKTLIFHKKHEPRWSLKSLDIGGQTNLKTLENLFKNEIIHCRKAEINSKNLVVRLINEETNVENLKKIVCFERFGNNDIDFDYNYLFIEKKVDNKRLITDESIGTTAGARYFEEQHQVVDMIEKYDKLVVLNCEEALSKETVLKHINKNKLGIVICFFGDDKLRIKSAKKAVEEFKKQTAWSKSDVVFIELIKEGGKSNFNYNKNKDNINHVVIFENELNINLFQKECLWNIGAKKIEKEIDNFIFIDIDTFPQDKKLFAKANKILRIDPNIVFQLGNVVITQKNDGTISRVQWLWNSFSKLQAINYHYCFNPCGGFAISKKIYNQIGGFNPYGLLYGGDVLFLYEIDKRTHKTWDWIINNMNIFKNTVRNVDSSNIIIKNEESPMIHCWHGDHEDRPYHEWGLCFNNLNFSIDEITLDNKGLLSWKNKKYFEKYRKFFENKNSIKSSDLDKNLYL